MIAMHEMSLVESVVLSARPPSNDKPRTWQFFK